MALRFHGTEADRLPKEAILVSMRHLLEAPDLADLVIPDLARWGDWSQIERLTELFKKANDDNSWVRVPVVNYLRACPLPEAKERLTELEKIDPKAVKRAATFFPIPAPSAPKDGNSNNDADKSKKDAKPGQPNENSSSNWSPINRNSLIAESNDNPSRLASSTAGSNRIARAERFSSRKLVAGWRLQDNKLMAFDSIEAPRNAAFVPSNVSFADHPQAKTTEFGMNSWIVLTVMLLNGLALGILLWMMLTGMFSREYWVLRRLLLSKS